MTSSSDTPRRVRAENKIPRRRQPEAQDQSPEATPPDGASKGDIGKAEAPTPPTPTGKLAVLVALLSRPEGADIGAMMDATGWQAHSVRGAMAGALKQRFGLTITSAKDQGLRIYRIAPPSSGR